MLTVDIAPNEQKVVAIQVPVAVLDRGVKRQIESIRLVVTGVDIKRDSCGGILTVASHRESPHGRPDLMPVLVEGPQAKYTEEALKNKVEGVLNLKALVGTDGSVKDVRTLSHLPDGLDEQAIAAVYKARFKPAIKAGQPVPFWQRLDIQFMLSLNR